MGGVVSEGGGDKLNVELNLVPFIDLLSSLVLFLLLTAVWLQLAAIPVNVDAKGPTAITTEAANKMLLVRLAPEGYEIELPVDVTDPSVPRAIPKKEGQYDTETLQTITPSFSKMNLTGAAVSADDTVGYGRVVEALDVLKNGGVPAVSLSVN